MARAAVRISLVAVLIGSAPSSVASQDVRGAVEGRIVDAEGQPLGAATVTVVSSRLLGRLTATSNADGYFLIPALPVGTYSLRLALPGYRDLVVEPVRVRLGETTALGVVVLAVEAVELATLVVEVDRTVMDLASTSIGTSLRPETFARLRTERDYSSLTILQLTTMGEEIDVFVRGGHLKTEHRFYFGQYRFLTLHYTIERKPQADTG